MLSWKKIWHFIWKDDSLASWLVNVVIAIILVKFVIYPGLGLMLGTDFPVVAVVSCSMEHKVTNCERGGIPDLCGKTNLEDVDFDVYWETCGGWYEGKDITKEMFMEFPFKSGFNKGDIMVLVDAENINVGDVVVFDSGFNRPPIIHRTVGINNDGSLITKGDHNSGPYKDTGFDEQNINKGTVFGKAIFKIPYLGWVKVIFNEIIGGALK